MSLSVQCHQCGQRYKVSDAAAGKKIACPKCGAVVQVAPQTSTDDLMPPGVAGPSGQRAGGASSGVRPKPAGSSNIHSSPPAGSSGVHSKAAGSSGVRPNPAGSSNIHSTPPAGSSGVQSKPGSSGVRPNPAGSSGVHPKPPGSSNIQSAPPAGSSGVHSNPPAGSSGFHKRPPAGSPPAARPVTAAPIAQAVPEGGVDTDSLSSAPTVSVPRAPLAAPVAQPVQAVGAVPTAAAASEPEFGGVEANTMAEMLDEQDREDRAMFRGLRRRVRRPPSVQELLAFGATHKMVVVVGFLSLLFIAELFRSSQPLAALAFIAMASTVIYLGVAESTAGGTFFQASAWCYLIVLCAFPLVLSHREQLSALGGQMLRNPTKVARAPATAAPSTTALPPPVMDAADAQAPEESEMPAAVVPQPAATGPTIPAAPPGDTPPLPDATVGVPAGEPDRSVDSPATPAAPTEIGVSRPADSRAEVTIPRSLDLAREEALRERADRAFAEADVTAALRYLYVDALAHPKSTVWQSIRWSPLLSRPALAIRFGAVVQLDDLASQLSRIPIGERATGLRSAFDWQKQMGTDFGRQTSNLGGPLVITWLRQCYDDGKFGDLDLIRAPGERALRGGTYLAADTPSETLRAARSMDLDFLIVFDLRGVQNPGSSANISATVKLIDVAQRRDREVHAAKPRALPSGRQQLLKDVEMTLKGISKETMWGDAPESVDAAQIEQRVKSAASGRENPLDLLVELAWYEREKRLPAAAVQQCREVLVGPIGAKALAEGSEADRAKLLLQWLPTASS